MRSILLKESEREKMCKVSRQPQRGRWDAAKWIWGLSLTIDPRPPSPSGRGMQGEGRREKKVDIATRLPA